MPNTTRRPLLVAAAAAVAVLYTLWSARPAWADLAAAAALAAAVCLTWQGWAVVPRGLVAPALALAGAHALSAALSVEPAASWRAGLGLVAYGLLFVLAANLCRLGLARRDIYRGLLLAAHVILAAVLAQWALDGAQLWGYRVTIENTNSFALVNLLLFPALLAGEARGYVAGLAAAVAWLSASRAGWAGFFAAALTLPGRGAALGRWRWALLALGVGAALAVGLRADLRADNARGLMWPLAWRLFADSPIWGHGANTYKAYWMAAYPSPYHFGHPHNLALQIAAELGAVGLAAAAWLLLALGRELLAAPGPWAAAARAATVALLVQSLADVPTTAPYIAGLWLVLLALGLARE